MKSNKRNARMLIKVSGSTVIRDVWYNAGKEELTVRLKSGHKYIYEEVPAGIAAGFLVAPSAGAYFNQYVKEKFFCLPF